VAPALPGHRHRPLEGAEGRGSKPACAGLDVPEEPQPPVAARGGYMQ